ncbi:MAG: histidine kinase [Candidatus Dormibacteria bacterium]
MSARARRLAWGIFALTVVLDAAVILLAIGNVTAHPLAGGSTLQDPAASPLRFLLPVFAITFGAVGALVASRLPRNPVGWIFSVLGFEATVQRLVAEYAIVTTYTHGLPLRNLLTSLPTTNLGQLYFTASLTFILFLFPDGRFTSRRWATAGQVMAVLLVLGAAAGVIAVTVPKGSGGVPLLAVFLLISSTAPPVAAVASMFWRFRNSGGEQRQQIKWLLYAGMLVVFGISLQPVVGGLFFSASPPTALAVQVYIAVFISMIGLIPIAAAVAILKYRLYDVDIVISRTVAYGALAVIITLVYIGIVVGVGTLVGAGRQANLLLSIVATAVVAVGFQPARERLQKLANRLVYGKRASPYEVLSEFSERLAETFGAGDVLVRMARILAEGTGAVLAEVWLRDGGELRLEASFPERALGGEHEVRRLATDGQVLPAIQGTSRVVPVRDHGELLGALAVTKRAGESLSPLEDKLLEDLARQAGLVLRNVGLTADLQARVVDLRESRKRLVAAQDQERRRIERNLHDGAQQHLVALKVKLGLMAALLKRDPDRVPATLEQLMADADEALQTLRDLARGIYPPLLAEKGLEAALVVQVRKVSVPVEVVAGGLARYPQEVEAAVYFCVLEALQNITKYAKATSATLNLSTAGDDLVFAVADNGAGFDPATTPRGAGLSNMVDRIDALGGTVEVFSRPGEGCRVSGRIPVPAIVDVTPDVERSATLLG